MKTMNAGGGGSTGGTGTGAGAQTGGDRSRNWQVRDNDKNGKRNTRRYNNDNYCWSCGFDISHTSMTCKYTNGNADQKKRQPHLILWMDPKETCIYEPQDDGVGGRK
jgi:hypothetical protein